MRPSSITTTCYRKYRVRVLLTQGQLHTIDEYRVAQKHAYNWAVSRIKSGDGISEYGLHRELTVMRRTQE